MQVDANAKPNQPAGHTLNKIINLFIIILYLIDVDIYLAIAQLVERWTVEVSEIHRSLVRFRFARLLIINNFAIL